VDIFNKKLDMIRSVLRTYREYLAALDKQNSTVESQARAINALTDAYNAYVSMFEAQSDVSQAAARLEALKVDLATLPIEAFSSQLQAVLANVTIVKQNVDAFMVAAKAYSDSVDANLGEWEAYSSGVDAAISGIGVVEANYDAASRYASAEADRVEAYVSSLGSELQGIEAGLSEYSTYSQAQREFMEASTYKLTALGASIEAYSRAVREASGYVGTWNRAEAERVGALNSVNLALADQNLRQQLLNGAATAAQARIDAGWLAAQAQAASSFAQSSLGIVSTNVGLDGAARISGATSETASTAFNANASRTWGYSKSESVSA
jgi:chromosome segregation ATPase